MLPNSDTVERRLHAPKMSGNESVTTKMYNDDHIQDANGGDRRADSRADPRGVRRRFIVIFALVGAVVVILIFRFGFLMLGESSQSQATQSVGAYERGPILDRNGRILAIQTQLDTIWAWRPDIADPQRAAEALSRIIDVPADELQRRIEGPVGSVTIKRTISPNQSLAVQSLIESGELAGIRLRPDVGRSYPEQTTLGPVLGFVGDDGTGLAGIEYTMDSWLSPGESDRAYGNQVFLTIDLVIQYELERLAQQALDEHDADSVVLLTMDAHSGDLLGFASVPSFDPNTFSEFRDDQRRNRPISDVYEPGSVFKIFSIASFLQLGGISPSSTFVTNGVFSNTDPPISDLANYGTVDTSGILRLSSNVGAAYASETVDARPFYNMLKLFGFAEETGIALGGEERGLLARPEDWSGRTKPTVAIGQEIAVTAVQLISAASVFANRGILIKPNIIDKVVSPAGRVIEDFGRTPVREVVSPGVAEVILRAMESAVIDGGTARRLEYDGLRIGAKTGTAEQIDPTTGTYSERAFLASTIAILPVDDPEVIIYVAIDHPKGEEFYGGRIATPLVRQYLDFLVPYLGIPVEGETVVEHLGRISVAEVRLPDMTDTVPDFTGLPKRALLPLLQRHDISVVMEGYGWVVSQSPAPGTPFVSGLALTLEFE